MKKMLYELFPALIFFIAFRIYGIYIATLVGIGTSLLQVILTRIIEKQWNRKELFTLVMFIIFGGLTLYLQDPIYIKWKPTIIFWLFALTIIITNFSHKNLIQRMFEKKYQEKLMITPYGWKVINLSWGFFFFSLGLVNIYVAYFYSTTAWVYFKLFTLIFIFILAIIIWALYKWRLKIVATRTNQPILIE